MHPGEIKWIADNRKAFADKLSKELGRPVTELEAMQWLTAAGESDVDAAMQRSNGQFVRGTNNTEEAQAYDAAKAYIASNTKANSSFTDERGQTQTLFSAKNGEFYKPQVYSQWSNDANYRDYYWNVMGVNLKGDNMSPKELAQYEERQTIVNQQTGTQLVVLGVQGFAGKVASNVAARAGQPEVTAVKPAVGEDGAPGGQGVGSGTPANKLAINDAGLDVAGEVVPPAGSIRNVNPTGGDMNCGNCVVATDATLRGNPASAMPGSKTSLTALEEQFSSTFRPATTSSIEQSLLQQGNGAAGVVYGYPPVGSDVGHVFNVVNQGGVTRYLDGQTGTLANPADFQRLLFMPVKRIGPP